MATITDPARELGEIAKKLTLGSSQVGSTLLAEQFGVGNWSTELMRIIASIMERADLVARIVRQSDMDDDHKELALEHLEGFKTGFTGSALVNHWNNAGHGVTIMKDHGGPIH